MAVKPIPDGYSTLTPYLVIDGASRAIDFYRRAFGATELFRMGRPDGRVGHAELQIGTSRLMLADEHPEMNFRGPRAYGGTPLSLLLYVKDVDSTFAQAIREGAKELRPLANQFYGDRSGTLEDPFGHVWTVATHVEDVPPQELERRAKAQCGGS